MAMRSHRAFIADLSVATFEAHLRALGFEGACPSELKTGAELDALLAETLAPALVR